MSWIKRNAIRAAVISACAVFLAGCGRGSGGELVLRVCNWEEYIDEGGWKEDELIELDNGSRIFGGNPLYKEFENWYYENYGERIRVEYSCFGTNEDLYNQLTIGDRFDLVCPSDYMIMKMMANNELVPFSDEFFDADNKDNYYVRGVSPYIKNIFDSNYINGESWSRYAAGYMWGTTGIVYNPEYVTRKEASRWALLADSRFNRRITVKDNVRDAYFAALGIYKENELISDSFVNDVNYTRNLAEAMNDTSDETINNVEKILRTFKDNAYSFETDSGKADMVTGKVVANYQWSGDAVYTIGQASVDGCELCYEVPEECGNLWFDGWVMLKSGISEDARRQKAAEAFVNFISMPGNAVRNMYYIGYTSVLSGGDEDSTIYDYINWMYSADDDVTAVSDDDLVDYDISYFFMGEDRARDGGSYVVRADASQEYGALGAQYPTLDIIRRCAVMGYFDDETNEKINQMWINVRCFNPFE